MKYVAVTDKDDIASAAGDFKLASKQLGGLFCLCQC